MNLFDFAKIQKLSLVDNIKLYIENKNIKKVFLQCDYDRGIVDLYKKDISYKKWGYKQYTLLGYAKGFNYKMWKIFSSSIDLKDFLEKVKKEFGKKRKQYILSLIKSYNIIGLKEFGEKFIKEPVEVTLIEADSIEELENIRKDILSFKSYLGNNPALIYKREIKKLCGLTKGRKSDDEVGDGLDTLFA